MRFLRFFALVVVLLLAYSAQFILQPPALTTSTSVLPPPLNDLLPDIGRLRALFSGDLRDAAFFMMAIAAVTFGLLAVPWSLTESPLANVPAKFVLPTLRRRQRLSWSLVVGALVFGIGASLCAGSQFLAVAPSMTGALSSVRYPLPTAPAVLVALVARAPWLTVVIWVGSLLLFLVGCALFPWRFSQESAVAAMPVSAGRRVRATWPFFLLLLIAGCVYGWRLMTVPLRIDSAVAQTGLWAKAWLQQGDPIFFFTAPVNLVPEVAVRGLATAVPALLFWLTHDLLLSIRLAGIWGALLTVAATWLLGRELLLRSPALSLDVGEDGGQGPALLAAGLVMVMMATLFFSRLPVLLETVGWGALGCWALLRGLRTGDRLAVGLSGLLIGLSALWCTLGIIFVITTLGWWGCYCFVQSGWLPHRLQVAMPAARFRGYFWLWVSGLWVMAAPTIGGYWFAPQHWWPWLQGNLLTNWQPTLLALIQPMPGQGSGPALPWLHGLLVPLLFLALGALCFNFDRRITWLLLTWVSCGLVGAMVLPATVPSWPALLPLVPALGLALAFALDRVRVTVLQSTGLWSTNLLNYCLLGLLLWVGTNNWIEHYHFVQQQVDAVSAVGQELRTLPPDQPVVIISAVPLHDDDPRLRFFTNDWQRPARSAVTFSTTVPDNLLAGTIVLVAPADPGLLAQLQGRYPNGNVLARRDHLVNLLLYRYTIPAS